MSAGRKQHHWIMVIQRKSATKPREITSQSLVIRPETADWTGIKP